MSLVGVL